MSRHPLSVALAKTFRPVDPLASVRLAAARDMRKAKALAAAHDIDIEKDRDGHWVTLRGIFDGFADPLDGSHFCVGGHEVLEAVQAYVDFIEQAKKTTERLKRAIKS